MPKDFVAYFFLVFSRISKAFFNPCYRILYFFVAAIAQKYHVNKYPTMKLFRAGQLVKREYRGQRSAESLANYIREQARDPVREFKSLDEIYELPVRILFILLY